MTANNAERIHVEQVVARIDRSREDDHGGRNVNPTLASQTVLCEEWQPVPVDSGCKARYKTHTNPYGYRQGNEGPDAGGNNLSVARRAVGIERGKHRDPEQHH